MELVVIRHGLPETVIREREAADPALSPEGREQARRVAEWLRDERFDALYSSPLRRARETAEPLAAQQGLDVAIHDGVAEYDRESPVYVPMEDLKRDNYDEWRRIMSDGLFADDPHEFRKTVAGAMEEIIAAHRGQKVAVFCHGGVINAWASQVADTGKVFFFDPFYTSINRFMAAGSGERSVMTLNETSHLRGM
ncbi:MAG: histidine phosphatase family protein [Dehalococcoidia bacterium]